MTRLQGNPGALVMVGESAPCAVTGRHGFLPGDGAMHPG